MERLLILDDDLLFCEALGTTLEDAGHRVLVAHTLARARELLKKQRVSVIFIDVFLPDGNGLDLLPGLALLPEPPEAIVVTSQGDPEGAVSAITGGAWDYVQKPAHMPDILLMVERALQARARKRLLPEFTRASGIIAKSHTMRLTMVQLFEAAQSDAPVLISGETGTGKELMARAVHQNSRRASGPFVVVDCGAIAPTLMESELFGNVRGAFTGAVHSRQGLVLLADGGTLFLDEVGELALEQQKIFLRLLQERSFRPIGSTEEMRSNFRVVAATNRNLAEMAEEGGFRQDLLYRLQGVTVEVPPLRSRGEDVMLLARHAKSRVVGQYGLPDKDFSREAEAALSAHHWPGNVRELINTVEAAALASRSDPLILLQHLPVHLRARAARARVEDRGPEGRSAPARESPAQEPQAEEARIPAARDFTAHAPATPAPEPQIPEPAAAPDPGIGGGEIPFPGTWKDFQRTVLYEHKRRYLLDLLRHCGGGVSDAARLAGLSRQRLYTLLREHGIVRQWEN